MLDSLNILFVVSSLLIILSSRTEHGFGNGAFNIPGITGGGGHRADTVGFSWTWSITDRSSSEVSLLGQALIGDKGKQYLKHSIIFSCT